MIDNRFVSSCVISTGLRSRRTHGDETGSGNDGGSAPAGSAPAQTQGSASRCRARAWRVTTGGERLGETAYSGQWRGRQTQGQAARPTEAAERGAIGCAVRNAVEGGAGVWLSHRTVDDQTGAHAG